MTECKVGLGADRNLKRRYVLIAGNNVNEVLYTSMLIQRFDYNVCTAANGRDAFEMARTAVPALVIICLELPDMPGTELIERLKRDYRTAAAAVLVICERITPELELQCRKAGAAAFVNARFQAEDLFRIVQKMIERTPRSNIRISTRLPVTMNGRALDCEKGECVSELSEHGMYIRTLDSCPPDSKISVQIVVNARPVEAEALILYCHREGEGPFKKPGMGLKFLSLAPEDREFLKAFIKKEITKDLPGG